LRKFEIVKNLVTREREGVEERLYYRFRGDRWYGGIATGDVIGCILSCVFCWSWRFRDNPRLGAFYSPQQAFEKIYEILRRKGFEKVRLSGGEPTISKRHLIDLIKLFDEKNITFILETNGILIGYDESFARELAKYNNLIVRISFKGVSEEEFEKLTGAERRFFNYQFKALENLMRSGMTPGRDFYAAAMIGFSRDEDIKIFLKKLNNLDPRLTDVDWEYVFLYPHVEYRLKSLGLKPLRAVKPYEVPREMI
jgi:uncharacterized Fe-S cluster-containing radical SAM superfamily protein